MLERLFWFTWQHRRISWTCGKGNKQCKFRLNIKWISFRCSFQSRKLFEYSNIFVWITTITRMEARISTSEETFQSIFQTNLFDVLSEFALLVSCTTCSAYSSALSSESEKTSHQKLKIFVWFKKIWEWFRIFLDWGTALLRTWSHA